VKFSDPVASFCVVNAPHGVIIATEERVTCISELRTWVAELISSLRWCHRVTSFSTSKGVLSMRFKLGWRETLNIAVLKIASLFYDQLFRGGLGTM